MLLLRLWKEEVHPLIASITEIRRPAMISPWMISMPVCLNVCLCGWSPQVLNPYWTHTHTPWSNQPASHSYFYMYYSGRPTHPTSWPKTHPEIELRDICALISSDAQCTLLHQHQVEPWNGGCGGLTLSLPDNHPGQFWILPEHIQSDSTLPTG